MLVGDATVYEACASDDGKLLVAIDTTCDEEILFELKARLIAGCVQKLRKSAGLIVGDKIEVFYEEMIPPVLPVPSADSSAPVVTAAAVVAEPVTGTDKKNGKKDSKKEVKSSTSSSSSVPDSTLALALSRHVDSTIKRIKTFPMPLALKSKYAHVVATETIHDAELSKYPVKIVFTSPGYNLDQHAVQELLSASTATSTIEQKLDMINMYVQSLDYAARTAAAATGSAEFLDASISFILESQKIVLVRDMHYFPTALHMVITKSNVYQPLFPDLPTNPELIGKSK